MRLSARGQYGVRALVELARHHCHGPLPLHQIAQNQRISPSYLERILRILRQAGLVQSVRGAHGGYYLAQTPQEITVGQVVRALEGPIAPVDCVAEGNSPPCERVQHCSTRLAWLRLRDGIAAALDALTLADLIAETISADPTDYMEEA